MNVRKGQKRYETPGHITTSDVDGTNAGRGQKETHTPIGVCFLTLSRCGQGRPPDLDT